jgi:hypothetical protein
LFGILIETLIGPRLTTGRLSSRMSQTRGALLVVLLSAIGCGSSFAAQRTPDSVFSGAAAELDVSSYQSELRRCSEAIHHPEEIHGLRETLPRSWRVRVGEQTVEVSTGWLAADLKKMEEDPAAATGAQREAEARLSAMRGAATKLESRGSPQDFDNAQTQLQKILQGREFGATQGPSQLDLLKARMTRWIGERIFKLLTRLHLGAKAGNAMAWGIVAIAFLAFSYWVWKSLSATRSKLPMSEEIAVESNDPRQWAKDALAAAERGDYREAVHCAYWAAVVHLEGIGALKRDRARTPRESLRLLERHPKEQSLLGEFTRHFELIWYGYRPASAQDWSEARTHLEKMGCLAPSTAATANS